MTYACPHCGKPCLTPQEAAAHCAKGRKCSTCNGAGKITGGLFEPSKTCPVCKGSGVV